MFNCFEMNNPILILINGLDKYKKMVTLKINFRKL